MDEITAKEKFVKSFRSLDGRTINERKESLFHLLNHVKEHEAEIDFSKIYARTSLEEVFKVETLIFFRRADDLLKILYCENSILIHKVLKASSWFINEAFGKISGEELVTKVFPNISYKTKLKLLNKIANFNSNVQKNDEYFEAIKNSYGLFLASKLLASCSEDVILKCIDENRIDITAHQLLTIIKKYPKLTETIFLKLENQNYKEDIAKKYIKVFRYLARSNYALFLKLNENYKLSLMLGTRSSKKVFLMNKESIIKNPNKTETLLKQKRIINYLTEDRFEYFCNLLPKSLHMFKAKYSYYLDLFRRQSLTKLDQTSLLLPCFKKVYGSELWDHSDLVSIELFWMMSPDEREFWMSRIAKPDNINELMWISFMKCKKSVPLLIEKLESSTRPSVNDCINLIMNLIQTCGLNKDMDALFDVFQFVMKRCKNVIKLRLMNEMGEKFNLSKFTEEQWNYIMTIIPQYLNNEEDAMNVTNLLKGYVNYCFEHNLPIPSDLLSKWLKTSERYILNSCRYDPRYEKQFLRLIAELIPTVFTSEPEITQNYLDYLHNINTYNKYEKNDRMSYFENMDAIKYFKLEFAQRPWLGVGQLIFQDCLKFESQKCSEEGLLESYFNNELFRNFEKNIMWLIRTHPESVSVIRSSPIDDWHRFTYGFHHFRYAECFNPTPKFFEDYSNLAKFKSNPEELNEYAVNYLSHFLKPEVFLDLAALYYPNDHTVPSPIHFITEEKRKMFLLQKVFIRYLRNVNTPENALESLMRFCRRGFMKMSYGSLCSITNKLQENKLMYFIDELNDRNASIRKYSIQLAFRLLNKEEIYNFLTKLMECEYIRSIRKHLIKANLLYFLRNQDVQFYELLKENITRIDLPAIKAYDAIANNLDKVSLKYFKEFFEFTWNALENMTILDNIKLQKQTILLSAISKKNMKLLSVEFCGELLDKYLIMSDVPESSDSKMAEFVSKFIIYYSSDDLEKCIRLILAKFKPYIESTLNNVAGNLTSRNFFSKFVLEFCNNCSDFNIVDMFLNVWKQEFEPWEAYYEFLYLNFTLIYSKSISQNLSPGEIGESFGKFCNVLDKTGYPNEIIVGEVFKTFKEDFISINDPDYRHETVLLIAESILKLNVSSSGLLLSMVLIRGLTMFYVTLTPEEKEKCDTIYKQIISYQDEIVQMYLHQHILNHPFVR